MRYLSNYLAHDGFEESLQNCNDWYLNQCIKYWKSKWCKHQDMSKEIAEAKQILKERKQTTKQTNK